MSCPRDHQSKRFPARLLRISTLGAAAAFLCVAAGGGTLASTLDTLHQFCKNTGCADGQGPAAALLRINNRHFFGTTVEGGANADGIHGGVVFELTHKNDGSWKYTRIYSFCAKSNCADGDQPSSALIVDKDGNLYGTTWWGGSSGHGTVFQLTKASGSWTENVLYSFTGGNDGDNPAGGLAYTGQVTGAPWDEFSPLFGTAANGGKYLHGTAFKLISDGSLWNLSVIHQFNTSRYPYGGMTIDAAGNLYGATAEGGQYGGGLFYRLAHDTWTETILYKFCALPNCADGGDMKSRPVMDASGDLFGSTESGGPSNAGVVFELVHGSSGYTYKRLKSFCSPSCSTTGSIGVGLLIDGAGDLYGTTEKGGTTGNGALFRLHNGANGWKETVLTSFCCDQVFPLAPPILDSNGHLFGTAVHGGVPNDAGSVYKFTP